MCRFHNGEMLFREITGQEDAKQKLCLAVKKGRIPHAQLFTGPHGSGQLPMAVAFASYVLCEARSDEDACGACPSCQKMSKLIHPDLHISMPVNTTKKVKKDPCSEPFMEEWRESFLANPYLTLEDWLSGLGIENKQGIINVLQSAEITSKLGLKSFEGGRKIVIIWLPEKMNVPAANKLLKALEEPDENTLFLLATEDREALLPTILSRTQMLKLSRPEDAEIAKTLQARFGLNEAEAGRIASMADGNVSEAIHHATDADASVGHHDDFVKWMRMCFAIRKNMGELLEWISGISTSGREYQMAFLRYGLHILQQCLRMNNSMPQLVHTVDKEFITKFSPFVNEANVEELANLFEEAMAHIQRNAYPRILFLDVSIRIGRLLKKGREHMA
ncbi:MAG: DNA polymerase III subunit delta' [Flavobacteriales bacterium]